MKSSYCIAFLVLAAVTAQAWSSQKSNSYVGFWELSHDEDGSPKDTMEIRSDGTYISHGWTCQKADVIPYHIYNGDMYATVEIPGKGPISIIFRRHKDDTLSFTSPRSRNNAYYSRLNKNPCARG
jgi:hypothetical protein